MTEKAKLDLGDKVVELPVIIGSEGERAIDIRKLRSETGFITIDNGYMNTGSCESAITFLNGEEGILRYRGYAIEALAERGNFVEIAYLLIYGKNPSESELKSFNQKIKKHSELPVGIKKIIETFPKDAHPMGVLSSTVAALSIFYPEFLDANLHDEQKDELIPLMMGKILSIMTHFYRYSMGKEIVRSDANLDYSADFLNQMFGAFKTETARAIDVLLILHADHEQNCSTSTVRMVGSGHANLFATISAGIDALWGPLHGGANQAVLEMLEEIHQNGGDYGLFLERAKDKNDPFKLMGFGHRVYKNFDPRAKIIKVACDNVLNTLGIKDPLLDIAKGLESGALKDSYFVERNLYPNVDFYSGIIYRALNIPTNMFTALFALGRLPGWIAQWKEMRENPTTKIMRPRQIYVGENLRAYKK